MLDYFVSSESNETYVRRVEIEQSNRSNEMQSWKGLVQRRKQTDITRQASQKQKRQGTNEQFAGDKVATPIKRAREDAIGG